MRTSTALKLAAAIAVAALSVSAIAYPTHPEENVPQPGMFFSVANVTEEFEHDGGWCVVYTDPDAGFDGTVIDVDRRTYLEVIWAIGDSAELVGTLAVSPELSADGHTVFTLIPGF